MSLKILLADDSMTAQNMGKKILADAGYEVIAVSNGAAAVKKIAEQRPDLAILDIYMPGYTGLEVCERVKSTLESSRTPVLLTVGKMEPYRPEDGTRVRADGVIVKPFEATDLLAIVDKLAEKLKTAELPSQPEESDAEDETYAVSKSATEDGETTGPDRIDVPQEMQVAPALGIDEFGIESVQVEVGAIPEAIQAEPLLAQNFAVASTTFDTAFAPAGFVTGMETQVDSTDEPLFAVAADLAPPADSPVQPFEVEFNSAPQATNIEVTALPELEATQTPNSFDVAVTTDPALADPTDFADFATGFGTANAEEVPVGVIPELLEPEASPAYDLETATADSVPGSDSAESADDFEARVAAAMAAYEAAPAVVSPDEATPDWKVEEAPLADDEADISLEAEIAQYAAPTTAEVAVPEPEAAVEVQVDPGPEPVVEVPAEPVLSAATPDVVSEYVAEEPAPVLAEEAAVLIEPPVEQPKPLAPEAEPDPEPEPEPVFEAFEAAPETEPPAETLPEPEPVIEQPVVLAASAAAGAAVAAAAYESPRATALDESRIAGAIQRVLERLKPQLVTEIARELAAEDEEQPK